MKISSFALTTDFMSLANFGIYFLSGVLMLSLFAWLYLKFTPYNELELIAQNNKAAAFSYVGALLGFVLPVASVIVHSVSVLDMLSWAATACLVQMLAFTILHRVLCKPFVERIKNDNVATGILSAGISISVGILNAACMVY